MTITIGNFGKDLHRFRKLLIRLTFDNIGFHRDNETAKNEESLQMSHMGIQLWRHKNQIIVFSKDGFT